MEDITYKALCSAVTLQSNKNGFFQNVTEDIVNALDEEWLHNFGKLDTNKQRIVQCLTDEKIKDAIHQMMENVQEVYRGKCASMSRLRRQEADYSYKNGKIEKSLMMYTQAVIRAPVAGVDKNHDNGLSLAIALWERSTVLYQMKKMHHCLDDVKHCLKEKLPEAMKLDAYWRITECYVHLKQFDQARISLNILLQMTKNDAHTVSVEWKDKIQSKLNELITYISHNKHLKPTMNLQGGCDSLELANGENQELPNASSKLKIHENDKVGKFFVAKERIKIGDTLIIEKPYVSCLSTEKYGSHCHHCLQRLETAVPCTNCSGIAFCSMNCRITALSTYHKFECHYLDLLIGSGMSILCFAALRIVSQQNIEYFNDANLEVNESQSHPYRQVYNMVRHDDKRSTDDFLRRILMALFLLAVLKKSGYFSNSKLIDDIGTTELLIVRVLLRNLEVLQFNAHEISEIVKFKDTVKSFKTTNIGIGLYKTASYFNHECFPGVSRYFVGTKLIVKAVRAISKDQIIGDSYGPVFTKFDKTERRKKLFGRYWFECECQACFENWPLFENLDTGFTVKCPGCKVVRKTSEGKTESCKKCDEVICDEELWGQIQELKKNVNTPLEQLSKETVQKVCTSFDIINEVLCPPNSIYHNVEHMLLQYWMKGANASIT